MNSTPFLNLCTFANTLYSKAAHRLCLSASISGYFANISSFDEHSLTPAFIRSHRALLKPHIRGFGYWIWKPYICLQYARNLSRNSYFVYLDAGFRVNPNASDILSSYLDSLGSSGAVLAFNTAASSRHSRCLPSNFHRHQWNNEMFTKSSLLAYLGLLTDHTYLTGQMYQSGIIIAKVDSTFTDLLREWLRICELDTSFIDDSTHGVWDRSVYCRNENDQAVYSALLYQYPGRIDYSYYDIWPADAVSHPDWSQLSETPFHAMRQRSQYFHHRLLSKLSSLISF